ncbi:MAG: GTP cyclohydrolase II [Alphaproteobacteria bacterium]
MPDLMGLPSLARRRSAIAVERAAMDLRRGIPVLIDASAPGDAPVLMAAVEGLETDVLEAMRGLAARGEGAGADTRPLLILTHPRARTLSIRLYTDPVIAVPVEAASGPADLMAVADPAEDLARPFKGPFQALRALPSGALAQAIRLTKIAGLLPAAVVVAMDPAPADGVSGEVARLSAKDVDAYDQAISETLEIVARAPVPLEDAPETHLVAFRGRAGGPEHYAIVIGRPVPGQDTLVRLHSECFTGDLLGSLKCDCGDQLRGAIRRIAEEGCGIVLYLAQEGRGIGLMNKLRAYALQDQGFDTVEANERLGFEVDERAFQPAAEMLKRLGHRRIRLLSNNPGKEDALEKHGITVVSRERHAFPTNPHNINYLRVKAQKTGHDLDFDEAHQSEGEGR